MPLSHRGLTPALILAAATACNPTQPAQGTRDGGDAGSSPGGVPDCIVTDAGSLVCTCPPDETITPEGTCIPATGPCAVANGGCDPHATCTAVDAGVTCACNPGYVGDGFACALPVACGGTVCDQNATCTMGKCVCNAGFDGDGTTCKGTIGAECKPGGTDCEMGLTCDSMPPTTMCSKGCTTDSDCGSSGDLENSCVNGECYHGCNPLVPGTCGRSDLGCLSVGGHNRCVPGCSGDSTNCAYGTVCNSSSNLCAPESCTTNSDCPTGDVCGSPLGQQVCVPDCRTNSSICPTGAVCDAQGVCQGLEEIGVDCLDGSGGQSNCEIGYACVAVGDSNECTSVGCSTDSDCGSFESYQNACLPVPGKSSESVCYRGCKMSDPNACGRPDFICGPASALGGGSSEAVCQPDCRRQSSSYCPFGSVCDNASGQCTSTPCTGNGQGSCGVGQSCAPVNSGRFCVPDCSVNPSLCPSGTECGADGICSTGADIGNVCTGTCPGGLTCAKVQGVQMCTMQSCEADSDCGANGPYSNACYVSSDGGTPMCLRGCSPTDPTSCGRMDLTCVSLSNATDNQTVNVCVTDCRSQGADFCSYGTSCSKGTGQCVPTPCMNTVPPSCASGQVCAGVGGQSVCVSDCRQNAGTCPAGTTCDSQGICNSVEDIGNTCADSSIMAQSTCDTGSGCYPITKANYCSKSCASDSDCGSNGAFPNFCKFDSDFQENVCYRGCNPTVANSCGRSDLVCAPSMASDGSPQSLCLADCRVGGPGFCAYGYVCDSMTGVCSQQTCNGTGQSTCATGEVCANVGGTQLCADDCRKSGVTCPDGTTCDTNGICNSGADVGAPCADSSSMGQSNCASGYSCVSSQGANMCTILECDAAPPGVCGSNGPYANPCLFDDSSFTSLCYLGCSLSDPQSCGRSGYVCAAPDGFDAVCIPDCRQQPASFCARGSICSSASGRCETVSCAGTGPNSCPTGDVCASINGSAVCVPNCNQDPTSCPSGTVCDATGFCNPGAGVGLACTDSSQNAQSNCPSGYSCFALGGTNVCTIANCSTDADCGTNGPYNNLCLSSATLGTSICYRTCDLSSSGDCGSGLVCTTQIDPGSGRGVNVCLPDCRAKGDAACSYGEVCNMTTGACAIQQCTGAGQGSCSSGELCTSVNGQSICAADCRTAGVTCPSATACDMASGYCETGAGIGLTCTMDPSGNPQGSCPAGYTCSSYNGVNFCSFTTCSSNSDCGSRGTYDNFCLTDTSSGSGVIDGGFFDFDAGSSGTGLCLPGCDPTVANSCPGNLVCGTQPDPFTGGTDNVCVVDCRTQTAGYCEYGTVCSSTTGQCVKQACDPSMSTSCPTGDVCATSTPGSFCAEDCRTTGVMCPGTTGCDPTDGQCTIGGGVGQSCTTGTTPQGTCTAGYTCEASFGVAQCTIVGCHSDTDCGVIGTQSNYCQNGVCARGCDPTKSNSCERTDLLCTTQQAADGGTDNVCVPDCRVQVGTPCTYPATCSSTTGLCTSAPCTGSGQGTCATGDVCATIGTDSSCVPDCRDRSNPCPFGFVCNPQGWCATASGANYEACTAGTQCDSGLVCVTGQAGATSICLPTCSTSTTCPSALGAESCVQPPTASSSVCLLQCDPNLSRCPNGSSCESLSPGMSFCVPL